MLSQKTCICLHVGRKIIITQFPCWDSLAQLPEQFKSQLICGETEKSYHVDPASTAHLLRGLESLGVLVT